TPLRALATGTSCNTWIPRPRPLKKQWATKIFLLLIKISSYISYRINLKFRIMRMLKEFKAFAMKGNVVDMAVGIVIGAAFGKIVASVVNDIIMPPIGLLVGGVN